MRLLANENFPGTSIRLLRDSGHEVESVKELMPGTDDTTVLKYANQNKQVILTFDKDYGELIYHRKIAVPSGLIYFKFDPLTPEEPFDLVNTIITANVEIAGWFIVLERDAIRKRKLPKFS